MGLAGDEGYALATVGEADAGEARGGVAEEDVIESAAASEAITGIVESNAGDEGAVDFFGRDARAAEGIGFAQAEGSGDDDLVPTGDFVPVEPGRFVAADHEGEDDFFALGPGFLDERVDVGFGGKGSEEGNAAAFEEFGEVGGELADNEGGFGAEGGVHFPEAGADVAAHLVLGGVGRERIAFHSSMVRVRMHE